MNVLFIILDYLIYIYIIQILYVCACVCLSVKYRRPNCWTDHDQIWHAYADRPGMAKNWPHEWPGANLRIGT